MKKVLLFVLIGFLPLLAGFKTAEDVVEPKEMLMLPAPQFIGEENLAYKWGKIALTATANDTDRFRPRPTVTSRMLALVFTSMFDAWSRYDEKAIPLYLENVARRPSAEQTLKNKEIAISYAAYRALNEYFYSDSLMFKNFMIEQGFDPNNRSIDPASPIGIGNLAGRSVIYQRKFDGSNQFGDVPASNGKPYSDYTGYQPENTVDINKNIDRWQPKYFADGKGGKFAPSCLTPHWPKVKPLMLQSAHQHRPGPPPLYGSEQLAKEVKEVVEMGANLTDEQKALVEFMRDGPKSVQQTGHWLIFAQKVSVRDKHTLDQDVKMYFLVTAAAMDAFIAAWDAKMFYDSARPFAQVHHYYKDKTIKAWAGPGKGVIKMKGQDWIPYSPDTFVCPPFPSYVSGHSTVSGACAEALKFFTGSDEFGDEITLVAGAMTEPDNLGKKVTLKFPTFTETANMAGISRVLGGYHIQADNIEGLILGRKVAKTVWDKYLGYIEPKN
jgi:hypothetical protein